MQSHKLPAAPTITEITHWVTEITERFKDEPWFGGAAIDFDDGGALIKIMATSRKCALEAGFQEAQYPGVKICFYSVI